MSLLSRDESALLVIDTQEGFYGEERLDIDRVAFDLFVERVAWVAGLASALALPVVVTEEDPDTNGATAARVLARLPPGAPVLRKPIFAAPDNPEISQALTATGRRTLVIAGLETDVCVAHSAIALQERGYRVAAVGDALFSPSAAHLHGLDRLRSAGVQLLSAKELFYDWSRTLAESRVLVRDHPELEPPPGFSL